MIDRKITFGVGIISILLTGFFAFVNFNEWYAIAILNEIDDYHFGSEGPSPYYYRTSSVYAAVTLIWGFVFLLNFIYVVWSLVKDRRRATMLGFALSIILFAVMYVHGQIDTE